MSKSKYPNQIDTSVELPQVRNNILQLGSEAINSLRSAVINIEKTLGINPQGSPSQTLSQRLDRVLDDNGNLKKEAISSIGLLSGPITDRDVSDSANIKESKINLDYPTSLLYSEISGIFGELKNIISQLLEINRELSSHISEEAINKHLAKAIKLEEIFRVSSDTSTNSLPEQNLQMAIEMIISGHINYSGNGISLSNNSHTANQIFFDNTETELLANNVQDAISEINSFSDTSVKDHQDILHGNAVLSYDYNYGDINEFNSEVITTTNAEGIAYSTISDSQYSNFSINSVFTGIEKSDVVYAEVGGQITPFQVNKITEDGVSTNIEVFGTLTENFSGEITVTENKKGYLSDSSLGLAYISNPNLTSKNIVELISPNSTTITSRGINHSLVSSSSSNIVISVDAVTYNISCHLPSASSQTPFTIVEAINERASELNALFAATTATIEGNLEIVFYCRVPNSNSEQHTLKIERGTDDGIDSLGLSYAEGVPFSGVYNHSYMIGGSKYSSFSKKLNTANLIISPGTNIVESSDTDLRTFGIKINDILHITGSASNSGSYIIKKVTAGQLTLDMSTGFSAETNTPTFSIINNTCSLSNENFKKISGTYKALVGDVFLDESNKCYFSSRLEYKAYVVANDSIARIVDFRGFSENFSVHIDKVSSDTIEIYIDEEKHSLKNAEDYFVNVKSSESDVSLDLWIQSSETIINYIDSIGQNLIMTCEMNEQVSDLSNLIVGRLNYNGFSGRFSGPGHLYYRNLAEKGSVVEKNISSRYKEEHIELPFLETRSSGVASGCRVSNISLNSDTTFSFNIGSGVCYIQGRRIEISSNEMYCGIELASNDKTFIYIDENGVVKTAPSKTNSLGECYFPKDNVRNVVVGIVEYDGITAEVYDTRFLIADIDRKVFGPIIVSKEYGFGHFNNVGNALKFAKRMHEIYTHFDYAEVYIKSGHYVYEVDTTLDFPPNANPVFFSGYVDQSLITSLAKEGLWIDFPVNIIGEGNSTSIEVILNYNAIENWSNTNASDRLIAKKGFLGIGGSNLQTFPVYPGYQNLSSGKVKFFNLRFLNTSVVLYDTDVLLNSSNEINSGIIEFDSCKFEEVLIDDQRQVYRPGIIYNRQENISPGENVFIGGLTVNNCYFKYTNILFTSPNNASYYNAEDRFLLLNISNNIVENPGERIFVETSGILASFTETTSSYAPKIFGNTYIGNRGKTTSQDSYWVSTVPTGINIHGDIKVGNISNSGISNSNLSEFYTNVYIKSGYSLTLEGGIFEVNGGPINLNGSVNTGSITASDYIRCLNGDITIENGGLISQGDITTSSEIIASGNITSTGGSIIANDDVVSETGKMTSFLSAQTEGPILYGYGETLPNRNPPLITDNQFKIIKRKNSNIYTAADLSHPNAGSTQWNHLRKLPAIDHGIHTRSVFCSFFPELQYVLDGQYFAWVGLSEGNSITEENPNNTETWDATPPYKTNTVYRYASDLDSIRPENADESLYYLIPRNCFMTAPYDGYIDKIVIKSTTGTDWVLEKIWFLNNVLQSGENESESTFDKYLENPNTHDGRKVLYTYMRNVNISGDNDVSRGSEAFNPSYWSDSEEYIARLNNEKLQPGFWSTYDTPFPKFENRGDTLIITRDMLSYKMSFSAGDLISVLPILGKVGANVTYASGGPNSFEFYNYGFHITVSFRYFTRLDAYSKPISDNFVLPAGANNAAVELAEDSGIPDFGPKKTLTVTLIT